MMGKQHSEFELCHLILEGVCGDRHRLSIRLRVRSRHFDSIPQHAWAASWTGIGTQISTHKSWSCRYNFYGNVRAHIFT
jgi:hypothetical protein